MKNNNFITFCSLVVTLTVALFCTKEYSCEDCYEGGDLTTSYSIYITPTSVAKVIYPAVKTPRNPGHYQYIDSIKIDTLDKLYSGSYNLLDYFPAVRGDVFYVFYEIRGRNAFTEQVQHDTLNY